MARNQEKAQSMLYRFREAQAVELGLGTKRHERRPRMVSSVTNVRECEKWRGEIMREISRKVTKIQDYGLTDYEVRDLNDNINQLYREKGHWERQIVALGGANYRSGPPAMVDDTGPEIPGMRGYRYFGRAKDLPGVRELFHRTTEQEEQLESFRAEKYKRFQNQQGAYFGNEDEADGVLLAEESEAEKRGWSDGWARIASELGLRESLEAPAIPRPEPEQLPVTVAAAGDQGAKTKREASEAKKPASKRAKTTETTSQDTQEAPSAEAYAPLLSALDPKELVMPKVADRRDIEAFLLKAKKAALRNEYLGGTPEKR